MRRLLFLLAAATLTLFGSGCGRPDVKQLVEESRSLAEEGDRESWETVRKNLSKVLRNGQVLRDVEGADRLHNFYVQSLIRTDRPEEALEAAERSVALFPESFMSNYLLGKIHHDQGNYVAAVPYLEKALSERANDVNTLALLTVAAGRANHDNAGYYFQQASGLPEFATDARLYNEWGLWLIRQEKSNAAVQKFAQAIRQPKVDPGVYMNFGVLWDRHLKKPKVAKKYYRQFLIEMARYPDSRQEARIKVQDRLREMR